MIEKLTFAAFVAPAIALLLAVPQLQSLKLWMCRRAFNIPEHYELKQSLDTELAGKNSLHDICSILTLPLPAPGIVMLLEIPLVLGFAVPLLVPLAFWFKRFGLHILLDALWRVIKKRGIASIGFRSLYS